MHPDIRFTRGIFRTRSFPLGRDAQLVLQLEHDPLRGLFSDTADFGNCGDVPRDDGSLEHFGRKPAQDGESNLRPDPCDVMEQEAEQIALARRKKSVENMRVLANRQMGEDFYRGPRLGKPFIT